MEVFKRYSNRILWLSISMLAAFFVGCSSSGDATPSSPLAPTVTTTTPFDTAISVARNTKVLAQFSTTMDATTLSTTTFTLTGPGATPVSGTVTYSGTTATFDPTVDLNASTLYTATVTKGAKNSSGVAMNADYVWTFTTGAITDIIPPDVNATYPDSNATAIPINRNITATFNEAIDPASLNNTTFTLSDGVTPVVGTITYVGSTAIFNPTGDLNSSTVYTATLTTGITDLASNTMASNYTWNFTTGTAVAVGPDPVNLGTAINYAVLAKTAISTIPNSVVTGNIGLSPAARGALTGWSQTNDVTDTYATSTQVVAPFKLYASDFVGGTTTADLTSAVLNMQAAYTDAAGRAATSAATTNVGSGTLTSLTLAPGVYEWGSAVTIPTDLTFTGNATDVWILKVAGTLDMAANKNVILGGSALAKNIFWQVSGAVTIGAGTQFKGVVLGQTAITMGGLSSIEGRLLAQSAITLSATTVTQPAP
ncbi:ice-binding family protein [Sulfuricurvum sp.]|uniref:ice-binding family protein n=1 Tax=Sulfuricurvum sp. TaxID=2025608 RepID=UPI002E2EDE56|nr:ice-binding family protein [Sulfuricurvum sp.]HEX5329215.1 ice-binding family protein [Sulfuricurvum sp.]